MLRPALVLIVLLMLSCTCSASHQNNNDPTKPLTIAVASNFQFALSKLIESSDYWSAQNIRLVTGSSGVLFAQITKGAPFDVFLSADTDRPQSLVDQGFAKSCQVYAQGQLVLWPVANQTSNKHSDESAAAQIINLLRSIKGKIAIANPRLAPFGMAALEVLESEASLVGLKSQLVQGSNVNQAFQFVDSGNASIGLVAESLLIQAKTLLEKPKYEQYLHVPQAQYSPIKQSGVLIIRGQSPDKVHPKGQAFLDFLLLESTQARLPQFGYTTP